MTAEERLESLERELSRAKSRSRWLLAGANLVLGVGLVAWASWPRAALSQSAGTALKEVRANRFILEDGNGRIGAVLAMVKGEPWLALYDGKGKTRAALSLDKYGPRLTLYDVNRNPCAVLGAFNDTATLSLHDGKGKTRACLTVDKDGPRLTLLDENGKTRAELGVSRASTSYGKTIAYPESSLLLYGPDETVLWHAP